MLFFKSKLSFLVVALSINVAWVVYNYEKYLTSSAHPIASISYEEVSSLRIELELCGSTDSNVSEIICYINESWPQCGTRSSERCQTFLTGKGRLLFEYYVTDTPTESANIQLKLTPIRVHLPGVTYDLDSPSQLTFVVVKDSDVHPIWYWFDARVMLLDHRHQGGSVIAQVALYLIGTGPSVPTVTPWGGFGVYQPSQQTYFVQTLTFINQFGLWDALTACTFALNATFTAFALIFPYRVLLSSPRVLQTCCFRKKTHIEPQLLSSP